MKRLYAIGLLCLVLGSAAAAQPNVVTQTLFTANTASSATSGQIRNVNQTTHWLIYCTNALQSAPITVQLQGSFDGGNYVIFSRIATLPVTQSCDILQASGYYPYVTATYNGLAGAGATISMWYSGTVGPTALATNAGQGAPSSLITTIQPVPFQASLSLKSAATSLLTTGPVALYSGYVINPNATPVYLGISGQNSATAISDPKIFLVVYVPANSAAALPLPAFGFTLGSFSTLYAYCSTALGSLADPATNCFMNAQFKLMVGVAPN